MAGDRRAFGTSHPAVLLTYFLGALVLCIAAQQPLFQAVGLGAAAAYYLDLQGRAGWRLIGAAALLLAVLTILNPLFNTAGETVLFTYFAGRPYTLQALAWGASTACLFASLLLWFACYSQVMTTDRFTYLFGGLAPALTLLLTMVLRLVPSYLRKARQVSAARRCIGKSAAQGSAAERLRSGGAVLSVMATWSLEGAIITADSMRSRGFGCPGKLGAGRGDGTFGRQAAAVRPGAPESPDTIRFRRTTYGRYPFRPRDGVLLAFLGATGAMALAIMVAAVGETSFAPAIAIPSLGPLGWVGLGAFAAFLLTPLFVDGKEVLRWRFCPCAT